MIVIIVTTEKNHVKAFESRGHAAATSGSKGNNLVCGAVSVLTQTLYLFTEKEGFLDKSTIESGDLYLEFNHNNPNLLINSIDMTLTGLENLKKQHPEEIEIIYKQN